MHDASITFIVGRRGSGKSTWLQAALAADRRLIVFAPILRDFRDGFIQVDSLKGLVSAMRRCWNTKKGFRIAYRPPQDDAGIVQALHDVAMVLRRVQQPYAEDRDSRQITLAVDEANLSFPHSRPKGLDGFKWAILQGRHWGINIFAATQRPTLVHPDLRDNAERWIVFPLSGDAALATVFQAVGRTHESDLRTLENHRYIEFKDGRAVKGQNPPPGRTGKGADVRVAQRHGRR